jgi:hypothetical protein
MAVSGDDPREALDRLLQQPPPPGCERIFESTAAALRALDRYRAQHPETEAGKPREK